MLQLSLRCKGGAWSVWLGAGEDDTVLLSWAKWKNMFSLLALSRLLSDSTSLHLLSTWSVLSVQHVHMRTTLFLFQFCMWEQHIYQLWHCGTHNLQEERKKKRLQRETMQSLTTFASCHKVQLFLFTDVTMLIITAVTSTRQRWELKHFGLKFVHRKKYSGAILYVFLLTKVVKESVNLVETWIYHNNMTRQSWIIQIALMGFLWIFPDCKYT